ncbi:MAG: phosphohistidine phosphatase SixA [Ignavibacterium sp.]|nr:phosphohistidine phosphatase SixA [Ignavibacterium sp.]MDW8375854.1 phosphohistidine phosphatase SixA [Ignavibacteriales bacterium]
MNLFLIRHSIAEYATPDKSDSHRELTLEGKELMLAGCNLLKKLEPELNLILTSPYLRAYQTAEIIAKSYGNKILLMKENNLAAGCSTGILLETLSIYDYENIAIVGHQPDLSNHISNLTSNGNINLIFSPASIAKIKFESKLGFGKGKLEAVLPSSIF